MNSKILLTSTLLVSSFTAASQDVLVSEHLFDGNFFPTVIAGVILALAFQFVLTALSVAVGITSMGNLKEVYAQSTQSLSKSGDPNEREQYFDDVEAPVPVKITTGFGIWSVLTTCLALFLASMIALNLNGIITQDAVIVNSLVIWALFFIILFYFETKIAGTLLGGLISTATAGFKASGNIVKSLFTPSKQKQLDKVLKTSIDRIRTEVNGMDTSVIQDTINNFVNKVDRKIPDYSDLKSDLENHARSSTSRNTAAKWIAIENVLLKIIEKNSTLDSAETKVKVNNVKHTLNQMKQAYNNGDGSIDGLKNVVSRFSEMDKKDINESIEKFKSELSTMLPEDFDKADLKEKISTMINNPKVLLNAASNQFEKLDRESIVTYLDDNTTIDKSKINEYADKVEHVVNRIAAEFDKENEDRLIAKMEASVENYFNTTGRPELSYEVLKDDFTKILNNPRDSLEVIKARVDQMDGQSVKALVTNNQYIGDQHLDKVAQSYDDAKQYVNNKISQIEEKAAQQYKTLQRKAVIKAEHARKTASSAAWWLVITAITSAIAAMYGGLI